METLSIIIVHFAISQTLIWDSDPQFGALCIANNSLHVCSLSIIYYFRTKQDDLLTPLKFHRVNHQKMVNDSNRFIFPVLQLHALQCITRTKVPSWVVPLLTKESTRKWHKLAPGDMRGPKLHASTDLKLKIFDSSDQMNVRKFLKDSCRQIIVEIIRWDRTVVHEFALASLIWTRHVNNSRLRSIPQDPVKKCPDFFPRMTKLPKWQSKLESQRRLVEAREQPDRRHSRQARSPVNRLTVYPRKNKHNVMPHRAIYDEGAVMKNKMLIALVYA